MTESTDRRLAAALSAGLSGGSDGGSLDSRGSLRDQAVRTAENACRAHGGRPVQEDALSVVAAFDSADAALAAALQLREDIGRLRAAGAILAKIGLHVGGVTASRTAGDAIEAARAISQIAAPGQIVLSEITSRLLSRDTQLDLEDLGERQVGDLGSRRLFALPPADPVVDADLRELLRRELAPLQVSAREGLGGMGEIYLARDPVLRRTLAVKVLRTELASDDEARARFLREARIIAGLSHPNIVGIHSVGELDDGTPYFVMDYVEGGSLQDRIDVEGPLAVRETRRILGEVASALAAAHERGVVHRDIKASNVLFDLDSGRCLVTDWGIAALDPSVELSPDLRLTRTGVVIGSPKYMSPEQLAGDRVDPAADTYALGLLAFELLTGDGPFRANTPRALMVSHLREDPPTLSEVRPDVDPELDALVARCLVKTPQARPAAKKISRQLATGADARLEWPPPGLDGLVGKGRTVGMLALAGTLLVHLPHLGALLPGSLSDLVAYELSEGVVLPLLPFVVLLSGAGLIAVAAVSALRGAVIWRRGVDLGYGWLTLAEVAADHREDTGALTTGAREYVELAAPTRRRLRILRLVAAAAPFAAVVALLVSQPLSTRLWSGESVGPWPLLGLGYGIPAIVVVLGVLAEVVEIREVGRMRRQRRRLRTPSKALIGLVDPWGATLKEGAEGSALGPGPRGRWALGWIGLAAVLTILSGAILTGLPLALMTQLDPPGAMQRPPRFSIPDRAARLEVARPHRLPVDSALDAEDAAILMDSLRRIDVEAGDSLWRARPSAAVIAGSPLVSRGPYQACPAGATSCAHDLIHPDSALVAAGRGLSEVELEYLTILGRHPAFPVYSTLARARAYDELRATEIGLGRPLLAAGTTWWTLVYPRYSGLRHLSYLKVGFAAAQYAAGDVVGAETTLRELVSLGFLLIDDSTTLIGAAIGTVIAEMGMDNLGRLFALTGRPEEASTLPPSRPLPDQASGIDAALRVPTPDFLGMLRDPDMMRQVKLDILWGFLYSENCSSPKQLLIGPSRATMDFLEGPLRDELVRYPLEGQVYDPLVHFDPSMWSVEPAGENELSALVRMAWRAADLLGNERLTICLAWSRGR